MSIFMMKLISVFTAVMSFMSSFLAPVDLFNDYEYTLDTAVLGETVPNFASNVNCWDMGTQFINAEKNEKDNIFDFVEYVQLMQCSGGSYERDLFVDPKDTSVLDDYDFQRLIDNCKGILKLGAKPHLKLGGVPLKYTSNAETCVFSDNVYPPDDYNVYYNYIKALADALVEEFGREEVLSWHFGVMTEYENSDWFMAKSGEPEDTAVEFCKLYDYTVQALIDAIGEDVYVGAHSMTVTEGLWDEEIFIRHIAEGTNYANGKKGSRVCYLSASFYDSKLGEYTSGMTLYETITYLKETAEKYGLTGLNYGIDEGRILSGREGTETNALLSRSTGYTWQAAYDARLYSQLWAAGGSYFSYWYYMSDGLMYGVPTVSYHVARQLSSFAGSKTVSVTNTKSTKLTSAEINVNAAYDSETNTLRAYAYNFKNTLYHFRNADVTLNINVPQFEDGEVNVTIYRIDDNCNWFDEWQEDRIENNITDDCFQWSPEDGNLGFLADEAARNLYENTLKEKYYRCAQLIPETMTAEVIDGKISITTNVNANTVVFFEVAKK